MKLNKKMLKDIIHEILMEREEPPPVAGKFKVIQGLLDKQPMIIKGLQALTTKADYMALIKWVESMTPNVRGSDKALILKEAAAAAAEASPKAAAAPAGAAPPTAAPAATTGSPVTNLQEEGPGLEHYEKLCEQGDQRACGIADSMKQRQERPPPPGPRVHPGMAGGMEEGRRRTKKVIRRRK